MKKQNMFAKIRKFYYLNFKNVCPQCKGPLTFVGYATGLDGQRVKCCNDKCNWEK